MLIGHSIQGLSGEVVYIYVQQDAQFFGRRKMDKNKRVVHEVMICMTYTNEHTFLRDEGMAQFLLTAVLLH